jgi:hypothetical protein
VLRDVQSCISTLAAVANIWEVSAFGIQKRISCNRRSRTWGGDDALQVAPFNHQSGPIGRHPMLRKVAATY